MSSGANPTAAGGPAVISAGHLAYIETQLASYIGPLARLLVQREARKAAGAEELIARLSSELDAESDRSAFARRCRNPPGVR
jgi:hypothetical protein